MAKVEELRMRFAMADVDGNGIIDRAELHMLLESMEGGQVNTLSGHWLPEEEVDRIMAAYDKDKNGTIDFEEFQAIVFDGLLLDGKLSEYEEAFKSVDSSGNGTIGATELASLFAGLGTPISYEKLAEIMEKYDVDGSGQIEFNEFLLLFRDQLVSLKGLQEYSATAKASGTHQVLDVPEGDIALIFSEQELDECIATCSATNKLTVLFCALTWCRPCKGMQRPAQRMAGKYKESTTWLKVYGNVNDQTKSMFKDRFKVRSTPCFIVMKDGQPVYTQTGTNKEKLEAGLRQALGAHGLPISPGWLYPTAEATAPVPVAAV